MADRHWKRHEREIARLFGGVRLPNNGNGQPDVVTARLAVQVKTRRTAPKWLLDAVDQAQRDSPEHLLPVVVLALPVRGKGTRHLLVVDIDDVPDGGAA